MVETYGATAGIQHASAFWVLSSCGFPCCNNGSTEPCVLECQRKVLEARRPDRCPIIAKCSELSEIGCSKLTSDSSTMNCKSESMFVLTLCNWVHGAVRRPSQVARVIKKERATKCPKPQTWHWGLPRFAPILKPGIGVTGHENSPMPPLTACEAPSVNTKTCHTRTRDGCH